MTTHIGLCLSIASFIKVKDSILHHDYLYDLSFVPEDPYVESRTLPTNGIYVITIYYDGIYGISSQQLRWQRLCPKLNDIRKVAIENRLQTRRYEIDELKHLAEIMIKETF